MIWQVVSFAPSGALAFSNPTWLVVPRPQAAPAFMSAAGQARSEGSPDGEVRRFAQRDRTEARARTELEALHRELHAGHPRTGWLRTQSSEYELPIVGMDDEARVPATPHDVPTVAIAQQAHLGAPDAPAMLSVLPVTRRAFSMVQRGLHVTFQGLVIPNGGSLVATAPAVLQIRWSRASWSW